MNLETRAQTQYEYPQMRRVTIALPPNELILLRLKARKAKQSISKTAHGIIKKALQKLDSETMESCNEIMEGYKNHLMQRMAEDIDNFSPNNPRYDLTSLVLPSPFLERLAQHSKLSNLTVESLISLVIDDAVNLRD